MRKNKKRRKSWNVKHTTLILFIRGDNTQEPFLLIGDKIGGPVAGWTMAPGGKVEPTDRDVISAAEREGLEEVGLSAEKNKSEKVAELCIKVYGKNTKVIVHVIKCTTWTGNIEAKDPKLTNLRFESVLRLPFEAMPTGEKDWLRSVLLLKAYCKVYITCSENRKDVIKVDTTILSKSPF